MAKKNLLEEWYKNALLFSSPLCIRPIASRQKIDFIYTTLLNFFGSNFFVAKLHYDTPIQKVSWLYSLLVNENNVGCINALYEISILLKYAESNKVLYDELRRVKNDSKNLRTYFFELFIYNLLDTLKIPNSKKGLVGNQAIEGTCAIGDKEFLFECRKVYLPKLEDLDIVRRMITDFYNYAEKLKAGIGMICTIKFKRPLTPQHANSFKLKIKAYFEKLSSAQAVGKIAYVVEDEYGQFKAMNYSDADLVEARDLEKNDVLFYMKDPYSVTPGIPNLFSGKVSGLFSVYESEIYKKLKSVLKEKIQQHKHSSYKNKIIFIDSETFSEFQMGLFQNQQMFDVEKAQVVFESLNMKSIVCIVRRDYLSEQPKVKFSVLYPEELAFEAAILNQLIAQYQPIYPF